MTKGSKDNKNTKTDKNSKIRETRQRLIDFSNLAKKLQETECAEMTINDILLHIIYDTKDVKEFNTFRQWKEKGYTILKGSKAYLIWGQPVNKQKAEEQGEEYNETEDEFKYFPVCFLFSDKQVFKKEKLEEIKGETETQPEPEYLPL